MKEYVKMYPLSGNTEMITLVSEQFTLYEEGVCFSEVFGHNYKVSTKVCATYDGEGYTVLAKDVPLRLVKSNFREHLGEYEFANWKYITR